jgi:hypothetical protein
LEGQTLADLTTRIQATISLLQPPPKYRAISAPDSEEGEVKEEEMEEVDEYEVKWMRRQEMYSLHLVAGERRTNALYGSIEWT